MKSTVKIGSLEFNGVKLNNVEFTQEYSANEAVKMVGLVGDIIKKLPETLEDLKVAFDKFNEIDMQVKNAENALEEKYIGLKNSLSKLCSDYRFAVNNNWSVTDADMLNQEMFTLSRQYEAIYLELTINQRRSVETLLGEVAKLNDYIWDREKRNESRRTIGKIMR